MSKPMALFSAFLTMAIFLVVGISLAAEKYSMALLFFVLGIAMVGGGIVLGKKLQAKKSDEQGEQ